jgi:large subunit ribosomal protein L25
VAEERVTAEVRESFGKGVARRLRAAGKIPAVIYGHGTETQHIALPGHQIGLLIRKANAVLDLDIAGRSELALVKAVQRNPVRQTIEHLDLVVVKRGEKVAVEVPVVLEGESAAETVPVLDAPTLSIEAEATHIPDRIVISIEGAEEGTQVLAKDVPLPQGVGLLADPDMLVLSVTAAAEEELPPPAPAEEEAAAAEEAEAEAAAEGAGEGAPEGETTAEGAEGEEQSEE